MHIKDAKCQNDCVCVYDMAYDSYCLQENPTDCQTVTMTSTIRTQYLTNVHTLSLPFSALLFPSLSNATNVRCVK